MEYSRAFDPAMARPLMLQRCLLLMCLVVSACGGGGGGSGGGEQQPQALRLGTLSPASLAVTLSDEQASARTQYTVSAPYSGTASGTVYVRVEDPDNLFTAAYPSFTSTLASLLMEIGSSPAPGRYTRPVTIRVCSDAACVREVAGSPLTLAKDIRIDAIQLDKRSLAFTGPVGLGAAAQSVAVTMPAGKSYAIAPTYVEYTAPGGSTALLAAANVFDINRTDGSVQLKPLGAAAGRYAWAMVLDSPGYRQQRVDVAYEVSGATVGPLTLLASSLNATHGAAGETFVDLDASVAMSLSGINIGITGTPDPVQTGWLLFQTVEPITLGSGPADNGRRLRFKFSRCGYSSPTNCLGSGTYQATVRIDVTAYNQSWSYTVPASFTVP
jgi:hypothetical protein